MEIKKPTDIVALYPVRKNKKQKVEFRNAVQSYLEHQGYTVSYEKATRFGAENVVAGDPEKAKFLVTAHYDTCARMPVPNLITPCNFFWFLMYQLFVTLLIIVLSLIPAIVVAFFADFMAAYFVWLVSLYVLIVLMMAGPANPSNVNDNTSGVVTVLEIASTIPEALRPKVCFVLFDLEEAGLIGSIGYKHAHKKAVRNQVVLNLDCVGEGDDLYFFPTGKLKRDKNKVRELEAVCGQYSGKSISVRKRGFAFYPSDQVNFPYGVGICALKKSPFGLYLSRIHTPKDTILEAENVNILRNALISIISGSAAE